MNFIYIIFLIAACYGWYSFGVERQRNKYRQKIEQLITAVQKVENTQASLISQRDFLLIKAPQELQKEYLKEFRLK